MRKSGEQNAVSALKQSQKPGVHRLDSLNTWNADIQKNMLNTKAAKVGTVLCI